VVQRFVYVHQHAGRVDEALSLEEVKHAAEVQHDGDVKKHTTEVKHASLDSLAKGP
jgi:hypothetical protein